MDALPAVGVGQEKSKIKNGDLNPEFHELLAEEAKGQYAALIRKIIEISDTDLNQTLDDDTRGSSTIAANLLQPTRIYVKSLLSLIKTLPVKGLSHITGGGFLENVPRILPDNTRAVIDTQSWQMPAIFQWLQRTGRVATTEMHRTFNCGVGMVV